MDDLQQKLLAVAEHVIQLHGRAKRTKPEWLSDQELGVVLQVRVPVRSTFRFARDTRGDNLLEITNRFGQQKTVLLDFVEDSTLQKILHNACLSRHQLKDCCREAQTRMVEALGELPEGLEQLDG